MKNTFQLVCAKDFIYSYCDEFKIPCSSITEQLFIDHLSQLDFGQTTMDSIMLDTTELKEYYGEIKELINSITFNLN